MSSKGSGKGLRGAFMLLAAAAMASAAISAQKRDNTPIRPSIPKVDRHTPNRVFLERANELRKERFDSFQIVVGDVMFRQGDMFMYCDSAHFYEDPGAVQAFGNVRMEQGDTLFVYADRLDYADTTELAILFADSGNKVRLINRDVTLTTDIFNYDLAIELGFYEVGGTLTDKNNRLKSWYGEYSPASKDALFKDQVVLHSLREKDTLDIFTEEMLYNTDTRIAILDTVSTIVSADGTIYTSNGAYNTDTQKADLFDRSLVVAKNGNTLCGDTLYYNQETGFGEAFGNIELTDTTNKVILTGDYGLYFEKNDSARVTGRALAREYSQKDTLYLHADTIRAFMKFTPEHITEDSVTIAADSTHYLIAEPHVRFYRIDLQGICDSLTAVQRDSMLWMHNHPIVWNGVRQIFGNVIQVHFKDSVADWAKLPDFGFMAEWIDENFYNQLTGKEMTAYFQGRDLRHLDVSGNVQAIMLPMENDSTYNKIANIESSFLAADFKDRAIERMKLWPETSGTMTPLYLAKKNLFFLPAFRWFEPLRPTSPEDVFNVPNEMLDLFNEPPFGGRSAPSRE